MKTLKNTIITMGIIMALTGHADTVWQGSAILVIKPEKLKEFKKAVSRIIEPTRKEVGCITYYGYQVIDDKGKETNRFEFHEIWKSKEAMLVDHKEKSAHMQKFFKEIKTDTENSFLESFEVKGQAVQIIK
ncbi:MAG: putative quinol monooxygenase [Bacteriovoracaceae bacterium]